MTSVVDVDSAQRLTGKVDQPWPRRRTSPCAAARPSSTARPHLPHLSEPSLRAKHLDDRARPQSASTMTAIATIDERALLLRMERCRRDVRHGAVQLRAGFNGATLGGVTLPPALYPGGGR